MPHGLRCLSGQLDSHTKARTSTRSGDLHCSFRHRLLSDRFKYLSLLLFIERRLETNQSPGPSLRSPLTINLRQSRPGTLQDPGCLIVLRRSSMKIRIYLCSVLIFLSAGRLPCSAERDLGDAQRPNRGCTWRGSERRQRITPRISKQINNSQPPATRRSLSLPLPSHRHLRSQDRRARASRP